MLRWQSRGSKCLILMSLWPLLVNLENNQWKKVECKGMLRKKSHVKYQWESDGPWAWVQVSWICGTHERDCLEIKKWLWVGNQTRAEDGGLLITQSEREPRWRHVLPLQECEQGAVTGKGSEGNLEVMHSVETEGGSASGSQGSQTTSNYFQLTWSLVLLHLLFVWLHSSKPISLYHQLLPRKAKMGFQDKLYTESQFLNDPQRLKNQ